MRVFRKHSRCSRFLLWGSLFVWSYGKVCTKMAMARGGGSGGRRSRRGKVNPSCLMESSWMLEKNQISELCGKMTWVDLGNSAGA